ncbi:hypothetical protein [Nocardia yamanashiensis]|uniref:hypothetical protein n=1 Tax=Nocardia yamanashiensis TaxID=209247 RepID=UPI000A94F20B|nr:hypothetical protein [Nocardia yamanashiensis]
MSNPGEGAQATAGEHPKPSQRSSTKSVTVPSIPEYAPAVPPPFLNESKRSAGSRTPLIAAGVLAVLGIAGTAFYGMRASSAQDTADERAHTIAEQRKQVSDAKQADTRRAAALKAACDYTVTLTSYDFTDPERYFTAVQNASTGVWQQEFANSTAGLRDWIGGQFVRSAAVESHCGVTALDGKKAEVLASVKQQQWTVDIPDSHLVPLTLVLELEEQSDGRWLVSESRPAV